MSALKDIARFRAKPRRIPQNEIRKLANLNTTNNMTKALRNGWVNSVLAHIALYSRIVCSRAFIFWQPTPLDLILVRRIPRSQNDLSTTSHCLRVRTHHADGAFIVQYIFRRDGFGTDTTLGESYIFGNVLG